MKIKLSKDEIIKLINDNDVFVFYDTKWDYVTEGDNFKTCAMLEMNCNIEKREGFIVHIVPKNKQLVKKPIQEKTN